MPRRVGRLSRNSASSRSRNTSLRDRLNRGARCPLSCFWARSELHRRLCARAGRVGSDQAGALGEVVALESGSGPHREDPAVGCAGGRPRAVAGRSVGRCSWRTCGTLGTQAHPSSPLGEQDIVLTVPASFDEEARELTVMAAKEAGSRKADAARGARRRILFLDRESPGAIAEEPVRRADRAGLRRGRRHQRLHADPRGPPGRSRRVHPHRGGQAPAAGRRQPGSYAGLAGGVKARRAAFDPAAQRLAASMRVRPKSACWPIRI